MEANNLGEKEFFIHYVVSEAAPKKGFKALQYYTCIGELFSEFYLGLNTQIKYEREKLEDMVVEGGLIKLPKAIKFNSKENICLNRNGELVMVSGYGLSREEKLILSLKF